MAITCSWDKPLGTCYSKYDEKREHPITIWSGGNCLAVFRQFISVLFKYNIPYTVVLKLEV